MLADAHAARDRGRGPLKVGREQNERIAYTGDVISMYTHMRTRTDALNHFGLHGEVWNGFSAHEHLGDRGWHRTGAEKMPPIVARGVLIDVAAAKGVRMLPPSYAIAPEDLAGALERHGNRLEPGDVIAIHTERMTVWPDEQAYINDQPGLSLAGARWLVEEHGAIAMGSDSLCLEALPSPEPENWIPVHTYLLAERGVPILEVLMLEELSRERIYVSRSSPLRGSCAAPRARRSGRSRSRSRTERAPAGGGERARRRRASREPLRIPQVHCPPARS